MKTGLTIFPRGETCNTVRAEKAILHLVPSLAGWGPWDGLTLTSRPLHYLRPSGRHRVEARLGVRRPGSRGSAASVPGVPCTPPTSLLQELVLDRGALRAEVDKEGACSRACPELPQLIVMGPFHVAPLLDLVLLLQA